MNIKEEEEDPNLKNGRSYKTIINKIQSDY